MEKTTNKIGLMSLVGIIIGAIVGAGIFNLMKEMANATSAGGAIIGWLVTGLGMGTLALSMVSLTETHPHLHAGVFSYAREGFGNFMGFNSVWGYWISVIIGNVAFGTLLFSGIAYFIPVFGNGQNIPSIIGASVVLWLIHSMILRGIDKAALLNAVVMIAKLVPLVLFIVMVGIGFQKNIFVADFWGKGIPSMNWSQVFPQVKSSMLTTVWVFIGIEGAVVFSSRAKRHSDVGKATIIGFLSVTAIYAAITLLSYGIMTQEELRQLKNPAMAYVLERVIGKTGALIVNAGAIVSIFGAWIANTMLAEEIAYQAGVQKLFPTLFVKENDNGVPLTSTIITNAIVQLLLLSFLITDEAYSVLSQLSSATVLLPYACVAFFNLKVQMNFYREGRGNWKAMGIASLASVYMVWLIFATGFNYFILTILALCPGTIMYIIARRQNKEELFKPYEKVLVAIVVVLFIYGVISFPQLVSL